MEKHDDGAIDTSDLCEWQEASKVHRQIGCTYLARTAANAISPGWVYLPFADRESAMCRVHARRDAYVNGGKTKSCLFA